MIAATVVIRPPLLLFLACTCTLVSALFPGRVAAAGESTWTPLPTVGAPSARYAQTAVWTGTEMIIWGGNGCDVPPACSGIRELGDGAAYNPASGTWRPISSRGAPSPRADAPGVWTGTELLIWGGGGSLNGGAAYNPLTDTWRPLPTAGAPSPRGSFASVWTGQEWLIWGGSNGNGLLNDGAAYNPLTNAWRPLPSAGAPAARAVPIAVWTGTAMLVWGGYGALPSAGAAYSPTTNTWAALPTAGQPPLPATYVGVWDGQSLLVWGGSMYGKSGTSTFARVGASFTPGSARWTPLPAANSPPAALFPQAIWTGHEMLIFGGVGARDVPMGAYDPGAGTWRPLPAAGSPSPRCNSSVLWSGRQLLVWGGDADCHGFGVHPLGDGAAYTHPAFPACRFILGFQTLHDAIPSIVGDCLDSEQHNPANGDALQHTTKGLLVWRKADNFTAFTDGYHTWVNGPSGIHERLNTQRFPWETNLGGLPVVP
ncbi:MAG: Kelch repeat-containing protein [Chloroflexota bacterium]